MKNSINYFENKKNSLFCHNTKILSHNTKIKKKMTLKLMGCPLEILWFVLDRNTV